MTEQQKIVVDDFHKPGPTCRRCKTSYVIHILAERFEVWTCWSRDVRGRYCGTLNVWKRQD